MKQRALGTAQVTVVGCGDVSLAVAASRGIDATEVELTLHDALELGITLVESAPDDDSERLCGTAVRALRLRDRIVVATRVPELAGRPGHRDALVERLPVAYVQHRVEASLRTTRLDALPLVLLPVRAAWRSSSAWPELAGACARLVREGKVQQWGALGDEPLGDEPWLVAQATAYNLCERAADPLLDAALAAPVDEPVPAPPALDVMAAVAAAPPSSGGGLIVAADPLLTSLLTDPTATGGPLVTSLLAAAPSRAASRIEMVPVAAVGTPPVVLARRPLAGGALAGALGPGIALPPRDDRALPDPQLERIAIAMARTALLVEREPLSARSSAAAREALERGRRPDHVEAITAAELALRFVLGRGAIALPRLHRRAHLAEVIAAAAAPALSPELLERLATLYT